jgi:hypothetical protein
MGEVMTKKTSETKEDDLLMGAEDANLMSPPR